MGNWEQGAKGAAGGAMIGGSIGGPWGAAAGGLIGGGIGFFGSSDEDEYKPSYSGRYNLPDFQHMHRRYGQLGQYYAGRQAPTAQSHLARDSAFRGQQMGLGRMLAAEAQGKGIGQQTVRMQAQNMGDRAAQQQMAMAASARPGAGAQAYQQAAMNAGNAQSAVGGQAAMAGGQMQLGAMNQYGQFLQGARGQDNQMSMFNAGQLQQGSQFNADAQLRMYGLNDQAQLEALRQRLAASQMQQQGGLAFMNHLNGYNSAMAAKPGIGDQLLGMGGGAAGAYFNKQGTSGGGGGGSQPTNTQYPYGFNPYSY